MYTCIENILVKVYSINQNKMHLFIGNFQEMKDELQEFLDVPYDEYLILMGKDRTYADHLAVNHIAKVLKVTITVSEVDNQHTFGNGSAVLHVGYMRDAKHYVSLQSNT